MNITIETQVVESTVEAVEVAPVVVELDLAELNVEIGRAHV